MFNVLEGDGVLENVYHFLWTKDSIFNTDPYVVIPHTILYKYQKPCYWYFTSVVDHKLKKKSSAKVTKDHIKEVFTKKISKSGIIAYYIYKKTQIASKYDSDKPTFERTIKTLFSSENYNSNKSKSGYIIEYFDWKKFDEFLNNKYSYEDGILQKFEDPKGDYNTIYRLTWSPKLCLFEKCSNLKKITDKKYDIYERAVTYDGEEFQIKTEPLKGSNLPDRIEKIGMSIASHISNITLEKIKIVRMILNFKITKTDKIIFLWCSSLRIENGLEKKISNDTIIKEVEINKISVQTPENVNIFQYNINGKPIRPHKDVECLNCNMKTESYKLYEISFKTLIESHENRKRDKNLNKIFDKINMTSSGVEIIPYMENKNGDIIAKLKRMNYKNFIIPKVISEIYPKMKYEDYFNLKKDSIFCSKTACVCESCFLEITSYCKMGGANIENLLKTMKPNVESLPSINQKNDQSLINNKILKSSKGTKVKMDNKIIEKEFAKTSNRLFNYPSRKSYGNRVEPSLVRTFDKGQRGLSKKDFKVNNGINSLKIKTKKLNTPEKKSKIPPLNYNYYNKEDNKLNDNNDIENDVFNEYEDFGDVLSNKYRLSDFDIGKAKNKKGSSRTKENIF